MPSAAEAGGPEMPGDLPPLPSRFYHARPHRVACKQCGRRFDSADELNEHSRIAHPAEAAGRDKRRA